MTRVALISDTHGRIDDSFDKYLKECDLILHAGDYGDWSVIDKLRSLFKRILRFILFRNIGLFCVRTYLVRQNHTAKFFNTD